MAKASFEKIRIVGIKKSYKLLMQELHRFGVVEIIENENLVKASTQELDAHFGVFDSARVDFAIRFLQPYASKGSKLESILSGGKIVMSETDAKNRLNIFEKKSEGVISQCELIEEGLVRSQNTQIRVAALEREMLPYEGVDIEIGATYEQGRVKTSFLAGDPKQLKGFIRELSSKSNLLDIKVLLDTKKQALIRLVCERDIIDVCGEAAASFGFVPFEWKGDVAEFTGQTPRTVLRELKQKKGVLEKEQSDLEEQARDLAQHMEDLKILHEFTLWRTDKNNLRQSMYTSKRLFVFDGWVPKKEFKQLQQWVDRTFVGEVSIDVLPLDEEDEMPTLLNNGSVTKPFQAFTEMYGVPGKGDLDPTPYFAPFFFVFFGICFSDVGYGLILLLVSSFFLLFGKMAEAAKNGLRLLLFCGIATVLGGIALGGWFGMTVSNAPSFLINPATGTFWGHLLNPIEGQGTIIFFQLVLGLGVVHLLFALLVDALKRYRAKDIVGMWGDSLAWFFFLLMIVGFGLAGKLGLDAGIFGKLAIAGAVILIITQSRTQKNWLLKPIFGFLGLYGVMDYLSDVFSYSRLMALGLATGMIGFAMNLTAGILQDMIPIPFLGFLVAVLVVVLGHALNFALSLLGAFVHSGRLQFIEFFGKFYQGNGRKFKPFERQKRYLFFK